MTAQATTVTDPVAEGLFTGLFLDPPDDPYPQYRRLRETAPALLASDGTLVISRYADCDAALRHRALGKGEERLGFTGPDGPSPEELRQARERFGHSMLNANPPEHTRLRRAVAPAFTHRHVDELRPAVERRTDTLLAELAARSEPDGADFVELLALPLPVNVISDLLGVPETDRTAFTAKVRTMLAMMEASTGAEGFRSAIAARDELGGYFADLLAVKGARPENDLLSRLAAAPADARLSPDEMIATALLLFSAGFVTTTNLLGNALHLLLDLPDQQSVLREDPSRVPAAVEEFLRYDSPVQIDARTVLEPVELAGVGLRPGQVVVTVIGAANRDPEVTEEPDRLDLTRPEPVHLSFASGIHFCLGAHLARLEAGIVLERLFCGEYASVERAGEAVRQPGPPLRGMKRLPVTLRRAPGR
ncbi:cytochrome P450 [Actinocorallia sp. B10E7]|uniref:cytochrome P450 n=1 Tax=Actinocorallia sp. B10E7 TaxID=3153558 RepID=UPI00325C7EAE